jgi:hypothetical protein
MMTEWERPAFIEIKMDAEISSYQPDVGPEDSGYGDDRLTGVYPHPARTDSTGRSP